MEIIGVLIMLAILTIIPLLLTIPLLMVILWWDEFAKKMKTIGQYFKSRYSRLKRKIKNATIENKYVARYLKSRQDRADLKRFQSEFTQEDWDGIAKQLFKNELRMLNMSDSYNHTYNYPQREPREFVLRTTCEIAKGLCIVNKVFPVKPAVGPVDMVKHFCKDETDTFEVQTIHVAQYPSSIIHDDSQVDFDEAVTSVANHTLTSYLMDVFEYLSSGKNEYQLELEDIMDIVVNEFHEDTSDAQVLLNKIYNLANAHPIAATKMLLTTPEVLTVLQSTRGSEFKPDNTHSSLNDIFGGLIYAGKLNNVEIWYSPFIKSSYVIYNDREVLCDDSKATVDASLSVHPYIPIMTHQSIMLDDDTFVPKTPILTRRAFMPHRINEVDQWSKLSVTFSEKNDDEITKTNEGE